MVRRPGRREAVVSLGVILRHDGLQEGGYIDQFRHLTTGAYDVAVERLANRYCGEARTRHLIISEVAPDARRHWRYIMDEGEFVLFGDELLPE